MTITESIVKALENSFPDMQTYYGLVPRTDEELAKEKWDYFIVRRASLGKSASAAIDFSRRYAVTIIMEDTIPEGFELEVIDTITGSYPGLRLADGTFDYDYITKNKSNTRVEFLTLYFSRTLKKA